MRILSRDDLATLAAIVDAIDRADDAASALTPGDTLGRYITAYPGESLADAARATLAEQQAIHAGRVGDALELHARRREGGGI